MPPPPKVQEFGFFYPEDFVERAVTLLELSNWVCWPDSGGWADQDARLVDDVMEYLRVRARWAWETEHPGAEDFDLDYEEQSVSVRAIRLEDAL